MKIRKWWVFIVAFIILATIVVFLYKYKEGRFFTENIITHVSKELGASLEDFFVPVTRDINEARSILGSDEYISNNFKDREFRKEFSGFLEQHDKFSSIIYKGVNNDEFILYRDRNSYISSFRSEVFANDSLFTWVRFTQHDKILSQWNEVLNFNSKNEDWFKGSRELIKDNRIYWEGQYNSIFLNESVFAGAVAWLSEGRNKHNAIALEIPIRHLVSSLKNFSRYKQRKIFIISDDGEFIHIPASLQDSLIIYDESKTQELMVNDVILNYIRESLALFASENENIITFQHEGKKWWTQTSRRAIENGSLTYGIAIPENELLLGEFRRSITVFIILVFVLIIGFVFYLKVRKKRNVLVGSFDGNVRFSDQESDDAWVDMIKGGENNQLEFKSSLRWDLRENKVNSKLEEVIFKTVAAFSNVDGGTLLIGVDDEGNILGLENDFKSLRKYGADYFEIHLRNLLNKQFGITYSTSNLTISFPKPDEKEICAIKISPGIEPVYLTVMDKNGNKFEKFYVRSGNSSQEIQSLKEINSFISRKFLT